MQLPPHPPPSVLELRYEATHQVLESARLAASAADQTVKDAVRLARIAGFTWDRIATALGVTRQAACQRYGR